MPSLYYVFAKWDPLNPGYEGYRPLQGRWLITCQSRQVADQFFRALKKPLDSGSPTLAVQRTTPQFWTFGNTDSNGPQTALQGAAVRSFNSVVSVTLLPNSNANVATPLFPPLTVGPDWVSGGCFFIRNKRQPSLYWATTTKNECINISITHRTKFRISGKDLNDGEVLIPEDDVTIALAEKHCYQCDKGSKCHCHSGPKTVYIYTNSGRLTTSTKTPSCYKFGDFFARFGTRWDDTQVSVFTNDGVGAFQFATYEDKDLGDEWELC